jgi:hypothetical protein
VTLNKRIKSPQHSSSAKIIAMRSNRVASMGHDLSVYVLGTWRAVCHTGHWRWPCRTRWGALRMSTRTAGSTHWPNSARWAIDGVDRVHEANAGTVVVRASRDSARLPRLLSSFSHHGIEHQRVRAAVAGGAPRLRVSGRSELGSKKEKGPACPGPQVLNFCVCGQEAITIRPVRVVTG